MDSTRDPSVVLAAIQSKKLSATILDSEASSKGMIAQEFERLMKEYCSKCACGGATADGPACTGIKARVSGFLLNFRQRTSVSDLNFLLSTNRLVEAITNMPTTRTIIFISDGFNRFAGSELHGIMQGYAPRDRGLVFHPEDTQPQLERVIKLAVRYDVKFYTLDSRELYTSASLAGSNFDASNGPPLPEAVDQQILSSGWQNGGTLAQLARETGGFFFENNNDLLKGIQRVFADGREY